MRELGTALAGHSDNSLQLWFICAAITILGAIVVFFVYRFVTEFDSWKAGFATKFEKIQRDFAENTEKQNTRFTQHETEMRLITKNMYEQAANTTVAQTKLTGDLNVAVAKITHYNISIEGSLKRANETADKVNAGFEVLKLEVDSAQKAAVKITEIQTQQQNTLAAAARAFKTLKDEFHDIKTKLIPITDEKILVTSEKKDKKD